MAEGTLALLHSQLDDHFLRLHARRALLRASLPIFALEHGLSEPELALLSSEVRIAISDASYPAAAWLPLVVYSAELGYVYEGEEYWTTFESRTPGWAEHGNRYDVRRCFRLFRDRFGGATPGGAWAESFSIICWPITHAVLPTDLQRYVARLIYEYRHALSSELLENPGELGRRLSARSWQASSRFQNFAQNTGLLGQVAAALLTGDDDESPYLLDSTLHRIVTDLSKERDSHRWLRDAKSTALRVREKGFRAGGTSGAGGDTSSGGMRSPVKTDPDMSLERSSRGWQVIVTLPDLTVLAERLPELHAELGRLRAHIAGVDGPPIASSRLLYPGQRVRLDYWPPPGSPLVSLENGSARANSLLSDQCVLSPGSRWVFRVRQEGAATEVRGKFVRPGHRYVLVTEEPLGSIAADWARPTGIATGGVTGHELDLPDVLGVEDLKTVADLGLSLITEVKVRPVGFTPARWDGEGDTAWLAGECPVVAVSSDRAVDHCVFTVDGIPALVHWPQGAPEVFVQYDDLEVGAHEIVVALISAESRETFAEGRLSLTVLPPHARPSTGSYREGMAIYATPVAPTLTELWDGRAYLEIRGPNGARLDLGISLCDRHHKVLARRDVATDLPVHAEKWRNIFAQQIRQERQMQRAYEEAECCVVHANCSGMAFAELCCNREFSPVRWVFRRDSEGPYQKLIDNTESRGSIVSYYDFSAPDKPLRVDLDARCEVRMRKGGLLTAAAGGAQAQVILPPVVHDLSDLRTMLPPRLGAVPRTAENIRSLISLAGLWATASLPSDPFAEVRRVTVLRAITAYVAALVAGGRWAQIEKAVTRSETPSSAQYVHAMGDQRAYCSLASLLVRDIDSLKPQSPTARTAWLADVLYRYLHSTGIRTGDVRFAEFLLRLCSEPASLAGWPDGELRADVDHVLDAPVLMRAARLIVIAIHQASGETAEVTHSGWSWE